MRATLAVVALVATTLAETGLAAESNPSLELITCQTVDANVWRSPRWGDEVALAVEVFADELRRQGIVVDRKTLPIAQCPKQVADGCYGTRGKTYCIDIALERLVFSLALLLEDAMTNPWATMIEPLPGTTRMETVLDLLGRKDNHGFNAMLVVDRLMFPEWWETLSWRFEAFPSKTKATGWIAKAKRLPQERGNHVFGLARDLLVAFVLGHESFHSLRRCPIRAKSYPEGTGYFDALVAAQQYGYGCPDPPNNSELNADACGARWLERMDLIGERWQLDPDSEKVSRGATTLILQATFAEGLRAPPSHQRYWRPKGYLFPHLRTALVHRTFYPLGGNDPRIGICHDALRFIWEMHHKSGLCVTKDDVELMPERTDGGFHDILASVDVRSRDPRRTESCLSGSSTLAVSGAESARPDPNVSIRVVRMWSESEHAYIQTHPKSVQEMMDRPVVHARLSPCLPKNLRRQRVVVRYTEKGIVDEVRGKAPDAVRRCVKDALTGFIFAENLDTAFRPPDKPYSPPGYLLELELQRRTR